MAIKTLSDGTPARENAVIARALRILQERVHYGDPMTSPEVVRTYLTLRLSALPHEEFHCLFLDAQHRVIAVEAMFRGTLSQTSVYPREVVKSALAHNCAAVIFAHNHPSGFAEPSRADEILTMSLKDALKLVDIRVLDHFVVAGAQVLSFAERGLL